MTTPMFRVHSGGYSLSCATIDGKRKLEFDTPLSKINSSPGYWSWEKFKKWACEEYPEMYRFTGNVAEEVKNPFSRYTNWWFYRAPDPDEGNWNEGWFDTVLRENKKEPTLRPCKKNGMFLTRDWESGTRYQKRSLAGGVLVFDTERLFSTNISNGDTTEYVYNDVHGAEFAEEVVPDYIRFVDENYPTFFEFIKEKRLRYELYQDMDETYDNIIEEIKGMALTNHEKYSQTTPSLKEEMQTCLHFNLKNEPEFTQGEMTMCEWKHASDSQKKEMNQWYTDNLKNTPGVPTNLTNNQLQILYTLKRIESNTREIKWKREDGYEKLFEYLSV